MANQDLLHFTGGLQTSTSSFLRRDDQLELAINVHFDQIGSVSGRLGYAQAGTSLAVSTVQGLSSYERQADGTKNLFEFCGGVLSYLDSSLVQHTVVSSLNTTALAEFTTFVDQLFMVGATSANVFLAPANIDGTTYSTSTNLSGAPTGARFIEVYQNKLYMADVVIGGTRYPSRWQRSSIPTAGLITWDATDFENVDTDDGSGIVSMHRNKSLNQLLFFKENSLHAWDNYRMADKGAVGTTAHRSVVTINYTTFFFNEDGIFTYSGSEPKLISRPIQKWIDAVSDPTAVFAVGYNNRFYKLNVGTVTVDGVSYSNCEYIYSILDNTWAIYSYADVFSVYAKHKISNVTRVYAGTTGGKIMKFAAKNDTVYDDNGTEIFSQFMTKALDVGLPSEKKFIDRVMIYSTRAQNLQGRARAKNRDWSTQFPINDSEQEYTINPEEGRFIQFHFSSASKVAPFIMEGISFNVVKTGSYA